MKRRGRRRYDPAARTCTGATTINLSTGQRLIAIVGGAEFVVTKGGEASLTCNDAPIEIKDSQVPSTAEGEDIQLGKRYQAAEDGVSLLCVKAGHGELKCNGEPMALQGARKLPSSD